MIEVHDGGFYCKVILDSISQQQKRLTTVKIRYPRFIHSELLTHRSFARNSASSRAIPWPKMMAAITGDPVIPIRFGSEQKGMQTGGEIENSERAVMVWLEARDNAIRLAGELAFLGVHKSICNRLTEPFMWIVVVVTATEWKNFFRLRCHPDAEIHFQKIAGMIRESLGASRPETLTDGEWHRPYVTGAPDVSEVEKWVAETYAPEHRDDPLNRISTARCARVSYLTQDGQHDPAKDLDLFDRLSNGSGFGHWCYDGLTEVLTPTGWRRWATVAPGVELAAVDVSSGEIRFEVPSGLTRKKYTGPMYRLIGQQIDLLVTPKHRMVVQRRKSGGSWSDMGFESAEEIGTNPRRYLKAGNLSDRIAYQNPFGMAPIEFCKLLAFFAGDGSSDSPNRIDFNLRLPRKIQYLLSIATDARRLTGGKWVIHRDGIGEWFKRNCYTHSGEKCIPWEMLIATEHEVSGLLDGFKNSDGSVRRKTWLYDTTSEVLRDQFQAIVHLNGMVASVVTTKRNHPQRDRYRMNVSERTRPRVELRQTDRSLTYTQEWTDFSGEVFCATVSTGALLVRRNLKVCVSGNSPMEHVAEAHPSAHHRSGPFVGWKQFRKGFVMENIEG